MKYIDEFRDSATAKKLIQNILEVEYPDCNLMEFCGGHTVSIFKSGIRGIVPKNVKLISGPGCPVCVTSNYDLDKAGAILKNKNVILTTYGDMMKVPGSYGNLYQLKANGSDIRIVYSTLDALKIAENNKDKEVVFFGVGFETTAPTQAAIIIEAKKKDIKNFSLISVLKLTIPAVQALMTMGEVKIDGVIGPGHVSTVIGSKPWRILQNNFKIPCVLTGFEVIDILQGIKILLDLIKNNSSELKIQYSRSVKEEGNKIAQDIMDEVFEVQDVEWRGFGKLDKSGLRIKNEYKEFDAEKKFNLHIEPTSEYPGCQCGEVLRGIITPIECRLFRRVCTPENPKGPCMVSSEGTCVAYYNYHF